jgi:hypothetical protein
VAAWAAALAVLESDADGPLPNGGWTLPVPADTGKIARSGRRPVSAGRRSECYLGDGLFAAFDGF